MGLVCKKGRQRQRGRQRQTEAGRGRQRQTEADRGRQRDSKISKDSVFYTEPQFIDKADFSRPFSFSGGLVKSGLQGQRGRQTLIKNKENHEKTMKII